MPGEDWGKIEEKMTLPDGTRIQFWTIGAAWVVWPDGSTISIVDAVRNPSGADWEKFVSEATRWVQVEIERRTPRGHSDYGDVVISGGRPVFGVTPPPAGALGKKSPRPPSYAKRKGK